MGIGGGGHRQIDKQKATEGGKEVEREGKGGRGGEKDRQKEEKERPDVFEACSPCENASHLCVSKKSLQAELRKMLVLKLV